MKKAICEMCLKPFLTNANRVSFCPECRKKRIQVNKGKEFALMRKARKKAELSEKNINEVIREIERYNREHHTSYSYGQYMLLKFNWEA